MIARIRSFFAAVRERDALVTARAEDAHEMARLVGAAASERIEHTMSLARCDASWASRVTEAERLASQAARDLESTRAALLAEQSAHGATRDELRAVNGQIRTLAGERDVATTELHTALCHGCAVGREIKQRIA